MVSEESLRRLDRLFAYEFHIRQDHIPDVPLLAVYSAKTVQEDLFFDNAILSAIAGWLSSLPAASLCLMRCSGLSRMLARILYLET